MHLSACIVLCLHSLQRVSAYVCACVSMGCTARPTKFVHNLEVSCDWNPPAALLILGLLAMISCIS